LRGIEPDYRQQVVIRLRTADRLSFAVRTEIESRGQRLVVRVMRGIGVAARIVEIALLNQFQPDLGLRARIKSEGFQDVIVEPAILQEVIDCCDAADALLIVSCLNLLGADRTVIIVGGIEIDGMVELIGRLRLRPGGDRAVGLEIECCGKSAVACRCLLVCDAIGI
jgi:hypothetical protein